MALLGGGWSQNEKLSEIEPLLLTDGFDHFSFLEQLKCELTFFGQQYKKRKKLNPVVFKR